MDKTKETPPIYQHDQNIDIHIDIHDSGRKYEMDLTGAGRRLRRKVDMLPEDLYQLNEGLREVFQEVVESGGDNPELITELAEAGYDAFLKVFEARAMREGFKTLLSHSQNTTIEITTNDFFLPWELLYTESTQKPISVENFLGANYVISRIIDSDETAFYSPYITQPTPRIGLLTNGDLRYVRIREIPFFHKLSQESKIMLWELGILNATDRQEGMRLFELFLTSPLDIAHFACHAFSGKKHDLSNMVLSDQFEITLGDLRTLLELKMSDNPIVVLNACGTGNINSKHASFFAKEFLRFGARGVIATDCQVPDLFAAEFSEIFYSEFLDGTPIGKALFKTRRYFLEKSNDLTVLIYSMYADPNIKFANRQMVLARGE
jgi:CHAT domain-containing protein